MKENFLKLSQQLIFGLIVLSVITTILFFAPTTAEFFETNKFTAFLLLTILAAVVWALRLLYEKKLTITRTPFDIPILLLVIVFLAASLGSIDQFISQVGAHGRPWPSLFAIVVLAVFYFTAVANLKNRKQVDAILWTLIGTTTLASLIAIYSYFGSFLPWDFAQIRSFNTLGIINGLALLQSFILPISITAGIFSRHTTVKVASSLTTLIMTFSLILINFWPAYVATAAALLVIGAASAKTKIDRSAKTTAAILAAFTLLFLTMRFLPQVAQGTLAAWSGQEEVDTPREVTLPQRTGWDIAAQTIGKRPLLGTGPGTYQFVFTQLKPQYLNGTDLWSIRFAKSSSEVNELVTTTGIFGSLIYLALAVTIGRVLWILIAKSENSLIFLPVGASLVSFLVAASLAAASFATTFIFFLALALLSVIAKVAGHSAFYDVTLQLAALRDKFTWLPLPGPTPQAPGGAVADQKDTKSPALPMIFLVIVLSTAAIAAGYQIRAYRADYYYRQALVASQANDGNKSIEFLQKAIGANPSIDTYHRALAQTSLNAAFNLNRQGDLSQDQQRLLTQLLRVAVDQAKSASGYQILPLRLPGIAAANVENWESLGTIYQFLIGSAGGADVHAVNALTQAINLDPQNPILHDRLGLLYQRLANLDLAQRKFEDSVIVKPDFGPAHYHLAKVLIEKKDQTARVVNELNLAKRFLPEDDPALADIEKNLKEQQSQQPAASPTPASTASPSPSPSQKSPSPTPSPTPSPSPTGSPSPTPTPSPSPSPSP